MREKGEAVKAHHAGHTPDIKGGPSEAPSKVCAFPPRHDTEVQIAKATAERLKIPFVDPLCEHLEPAALALLDPDMAIRRQALPINRVNDMLMVAMASPSERIAIKSLEMLTGCRIRPAAAPKSSLLEALRQAYNLPAAPSIRSGQAAHVTARKNRREKTNSEALTISVISNKGGVGKTHFSINLAHALGRTGAKVLLIDADLGNADISNKLGIFPKHRLLHFLQKTQQMQDLVVTTRFDFDLICGTYGEFKLANLNYAQKIKFIRHFKNISKDYDFAILDLGAGIARIVLDFALGADRTVIVTTPQDLISGYACAKAAFCRYREIEAGLERRIPEYTPESAFSPLLVLNQVNNLEQGFKLYNQIYKTADKHINANEDSFCMKPEYLGGIPFDAETMRITEAKRIPFLVDFPHVKASQCIRHMSTRFSNGEGCYNSRMSFRHPFRRFMAILSQKI
jgi:flagellar biosynthesis protein FlhG